MELKDKSIIDILNDRVKVNPTDIAIERKSFGMKYLDDDLERLHQNKYVEHALKMYTWQELDDITDLFAMQMLRLKVCAKEHVGIWGFNSEYWVFAFLAISKIGAIPVLFNTYLTAVELVESAKYSDCKYIFADEMSTRTGYLEVLNKLKEEIGTRSEAIRENNVIQTISMCIDASVSVDFQIKKDLLFKAELQELKKRKEAINSKQPACMMFTSGTSSTPKGVILSHYSLVNNAMSISKSMHWSRKDKMCICVPMFHCFGLTVGILSCLVSGATMFILERFKTQEVWDSIINGGCTVLNGVPSMFLAMIRKEKYKHLSPKTLVSGIIAGSPISSREYLELCDRLKGVRIQPSYGQTETSPCVSIVDWDEDVISKSLNCGRAVEHVEVKISEEDSFDICFQSDEDLEACHLFRCGEILVRGYNTMMGYYKKGAEDSFTEDGWLKTGDAGYLDKEGRLHITGRIKEMIIRAGENISPSEIEECIKQINGVKEVKVIGIKAEVVQEEIIACMIPQKNVGPADDEIYSFLKKKLASYKIPSKVIRFEKFPLTANGKVDLKRLREVVNEIQQ